MMATTYSMPLETLILQRKANISSSPSPPILSAPQSHFCSRRHKLYDLETRPRPLREHSFSQKLRCRIHPGQKQWFDRLLFLGRDRG